jgi:hypothetical protein
VFPAEIIIANFGESMFKRGKSVTTGSGGDDFSG